MRSTDFDAHFVRRREALVQLIEGATGKAVQRDLSTGEAEETLEHFEPDSAAVAEELEDWQVNGDTVLEIAQDPPVADE
jgi:hypothetical protein